MDLEHIDRILSQTLGVSHVRLDQLHFIGNPNLGADTTAEDVSEGVRKLEEMIGEYKSVEFTAVMESLANELSGKLPTILIPIRRYLSYEWETE